MSCICCSDLVSGEKQGTDLLSVQVHAGGFRDGAELKQEQMTTPNATKDLVV